MGLLITCQHSIVAPDNTVGCKYPDCTCPRIEVDSTPANFRVQIAMFFRARAVQEDEIANRSANPVNEAVHAAAAETYRLCADTVEKGLTK